MIIYFSAWAGDRPGGAEAGGRRGLAELGELKEGEVDIAAAWFHGYGYPVYTLPHSGDVAALESCLRELGVVPFGRWGGWQYWNTDRIFEEARKLTL